LRVKTSPLLILLVQLVAVSLVVNAQPAMASQPIPAPTMHASYNPGDSYTTVYYPSEISPPNQTTPQIRITSPSNNTVLTSNSTVLSFDVTLKALNDCQPLTLRAVSYRLSWQSTNTSIELGDQTPTVTKTVSFSVNLTDIPSGNNTITIYAEALSQFEVNREILQIPVSPSGLLVGAYLNVYSNYYFTSGSSTTYFEMKTATPAPPLPDDNSRLNIVIAALASVIVLTVVFLLVRYTKKQGMKV
jgi:hypothetical protein